MAEFIKGNIVVIPFPFSDLTGSKRRPALVLSKLDGNDLILCQITSKNINDKYAIPLSNEDFSYGSLKQESNIRPNKIFTADKGIIIDVVGHIKDSKLQEVINKVIEILLYSN